MSHFEPPIHWNDHEDIAMKLYEKFGDDFTEAKIYRIRFTELLEWILELPGFEGAPGFMNGAITRNNRYFNFFACWNASNPLLLLSLM
jgi:FeS assembly protein IscX